MTTALWSIVLVVATGIIGGFGPIYLKKGSGLVDLKDFSTVYKNKFLIAGIFIHGITALMFIPALKGGELSVLYPLVGLAYVWVSIYSKILLGEDMNNLKWTGIVVVLIGVYFIGRGA